MKQSKTSSSGFSVEETIESLRKQLAEKDVEIQKLALDCLSVDGQAFDNWVQLAASQLREQQLRAHLEIIAGKRMCVDNCLGNVDIAELALALPQATTALEAMIAKAGEVMRERCANECEKFEYPASREAESIRAIPSVKLEDLK